MAERHICWMSGVLATTSCVTMGPLVACTPVVAQMKQNFSQILGMASTSRWPSMAGHLSKMALTVCVLADGGPSNSPKVM